MKVEDLLKERLDNALTESVDEYGKATRYGGKSRLYWLTEGCIKNKLESLRETTIKENEAHIENVKKELTEQIKQTFNEKLVNEIAGVLIKEFGLKAFQQ